MYAIGIDIGKDSHTFAIYHRETGEIVKDPSNFKNSKEGFKQLLDSFKKYPKKDVFIGMEDTGHYHFTLLKFLLENKFKVGLINPRLTDLTRRAAGNTSKNDNLDSLTICDILSSFERNKKYRITEIDKFDLYEQKYLTRHHHDLKEQINVYKNRLEKSVDIAFPEFNKLFKSKHGIVYMNILKTFGSASSIASADIRTIRKCFEVTGKGNRISLTAAKLKEAAKESIGFSFPSDELQIKHLVEQIELIEKQIEEIDKKIEEFSVSNNSPIISIPGISHFSGTSILAEYGDIHNFDSETKMISFAGVAPYVYKSSQYEAAHLSITKKGSKYLRKTLYQIVLPVINNNSVFKKLL